MSTQDVAMKAISGVGINHGTVVIGVPVTALTGASMYHGRAYEGVDVTVLEDRLTNRFDEVTYYTA